MKRVMHFTAAVGLALTVAACAGDDARPSENATPSGSAAPTGTSGTANADRDFIEEHLAMGNAEVELGRLAQQRATHPDVKEFGAMMVRDHQMAGEELRSLASKANLNTAENRAEAGARNAQTELREELAKLSGREFDRRYIDEMIDDHQEAVEDLEEKARDASNADVKAWASKTLPKVQQHLERARSIKETLDRAGNERGGK